MADVDGTDTDEPPVGDLRRAGDEHAADGPRSGGDRHSGEPRVDGRVARRQRNIDAVVDVVLDMFAEDALFPTMEEAATRSGLSLRSLYRYFADHDELLEAAVERGRARGADVAHLRAIGTGPLDRRIDDFATMRVALYETVGPYYRAVTAHADRRVRLRESRARNRRDLGIQFGAQFAPELDAMDDHARAVAFTTGDVMTQLDSIDFMRRHRELSVPDTEAALRFALTQLLR